MSVGVGIGVGVGVAVRDRKNSLPSIPCRESPAALHKHQHQREKLEQQPRAGSRQEYRTRQLQAKRRRYSPFGIIDWLANRGEREGGRKRWERNGLLLVPSSTVVCGLNLRSLFKTADTLTTGRKRRRRGIGARHSVSLNPSLSYSVGGDRARNRVSARAEVSGAGASSAASSSTSHFQNWTSQRASFIVANL